jgi:FKBP-type peptidyl-prolyl cis-trans isomerase FklB
MRLTLYYLFSLFLIWEKGMLYGAMIKTSAMAVFLGLSLVYANSYAVEQSTTGDQTQMQSVNSSSLADQNKATGDAFMSANKTKPGVVTLPSGLQYKILVEGKGAQPSATDTVSVHYTGHLIDGTVFDSSIQRGQPATFPVNGVIPGWVEALQLMKVGSTWELYIPAKLAYGEQGVPPAIGPNETLIFKVQLLDVKKS